MSWKRRISMVAIATAITTAMVVGPVSAMPPDFGSVVKCKYKVTQYTDGLWDQAELRMVAVIPPVMFATEPGNHVGWRYLLSRSIANGPYRQLSKSHIQKRIPYLTDSAQFDVMHARVSLPDVAAPDLVRYRVTIVMFHYNADGSVNTRTSHLLPYHITSFDGVKDNQGLDYCQGTATNPAG